MSTTNQTQDHRAEDQAKAQFDSIKVMVERLIHAQTCPRSEYHRGKCHLTDAEIFGGLGLYYKQGHPKYGQRPTKDQRVEYHNEEAARQAIEEDPLSVEVRSGWHTPGDPEVGNEEYIILLCTGGPAVRIVGTLDQYNQPETARLEYQDWFTPWEEYHLDSEEEQIAVTYAQQFYYGG